MFEHDVKLNKKATTKDLTKHINDMYKNRWTRSYSYIKSKPHLIKNISFAKNAHMVNDKDAFSDYLNYMCEIVLAQDIGIDPHYNSSLRQELLNEVSYWNMNQGAYCIYMSTLLYGLLTRNNIVSPANLTYYQGFYDFKTSDSNFFAVQLFGDRQMGIHAWLTLGDSLIDLTANQNKTVFDFDFDKFPIILGEFPTGYNLFGFKENLNTVEYYWNLFAEHAGVTVDEWFSRHEKACKEFADS